MDSGKKINHNLRTARSCPVEVAGWYGISAIILAYGLVSFDLIDADSYLYQILNLTGAIGVVFISCAKGARQPLILNIFWAGIAASAILALII